MREYFVISLFEISRVDLLIPNFARKLVLHANGSYSFWPKEFYKFPKSIYLHAFEFLAIIVMNPVCLNEPLTVVMLIYL